MPRCPRLQIAGGIYHVTARGNRRQPTFLDHDDHRFHLRCLDRAAAVCGWECLAYVQMPNHFHLLLRTPEANLSRGMHRLNGLYAQVFNDRHGLTGHVFQGRFYSELVHDDAHLCTLARYLALNPVRAGICANPLAWPWSSCGATLGLVGAPDFLDNRWLVGPFGRDLDGARQRYWAFVEEGVPARSSMSDMAGA